MTRVKDALFVAAFPATGDAATWATGVPWQWAPLATGAAWALFAGFCALAGPAFGGGGPASYDADTLTWLPDDKGRD